MRFFHAACLLAALTVLSSCAETEFASHIFKTAAPPPPNQGTFKVGPSYWADGRRYTPQETYNYSETGIASWYGAEFQGRRTANGERFDKNELTAAHRTLQMPSLVKVTNLDNGRSLVVRVNDRGPFKRGRVIDLSQRAASLLGFIGRGTAKVRLDLLANESRAIAMAARSGRDTSGMEVAVNERFASGEQAPPPAGFNVATSQPVMVQPAMAPVIPGHVKNGAFYPNPVVGHEPVKPTSIYVQAGAFGNSANAENLLRQVQGFGTAQIYPAIINGRQFFRVRLGPVPSVDAADMLLDRMAKAGYKQAITVVN